MIKSLNLEVNTIISKIVRQSKNSIDTYSQKKNKFVVAGTRNDTKIWSGIIKNNEMSIFKFPLTVNYIGKKFRWLFVN